MIKKQNAISRHTGKSTIFGIMAGAVLLSQSLIVQAEPKVMKDGAVFDAEYYSKTYPDVAAVYGTSETALYQHYVEYGKAENRKATADSDKDIFDAEYYAEQNPDVVAVYGNDSNSLYQHYLQYGKKEGRKPATSAETISQTSDHKSGASPVTENVQTKNSPANEKILRRGADVDGWDVIKSQSDWIKYPVEDCFQTASGVYVVCRGWICQFFDSKGNGSLGQHSLWQLGDYGDGTPYTEYGWSKEGVHFWKAN